MSPLEKRAALLELIGASIYKRRCELGLSQEELANKSSVHRTYISDVERGIRNISILTLDRIANALDIPLGVLLIFNTSGAPPVMNNKKGRAPSQPIVKSER